MPAELAPLPQCGRSATLTVSRAFQGLVLDLSQAPDRPRKIKHSLGYQMVELDRWAHHPDRGGSNGRIKARTQKLKIIGKKA